MPRVRVKFSPLLHMPRWFSARDADPGWMRAALLILAGEPLQDSGGPSILLSYPVLFSISFLSPNRYPTSYKGCICHSPAGHLTTNGVLDNTFCTTITARGSCPVTAFRIYQNLMWNIYIPADLACRAGRSHSRHLPFPRVLLKSKVQLLSSSSIYVMEAFSTFVKGLPVLVACVMASASYPPIPADLTTPVQQRIAINGPNGTF